MLLYIVNSFAAISEKIFSRHQSRGAKKPGQAGRKGERWRLLLRRRILVWGAIKIQHPIHQPKPLSLSYNACERWSLTGQREQPGVIGRPCRWRAWFSCRLHCELECGPGRVYALGRRGDGDDGKFHSRL